MIVTSFQSFVPKVQSKTLKISDIFNELTENQKSIFCPSNLNTIYSGPQNYNISKHKTIKDFNAFGLSRKLDLIYENTRQPLQRDAFYVLYFVVNDLIIECHYKKPLKQILRNE